MAHLYLIGMPGAGKSTLGKLLAAELNLPFVDLDTAIEKATGTTISQIFDLKGEEYFREMETVVLKTVAFSSEKLVIATGGGTPCFSGNMDFLNQTGLTVYLRAEPEILAERLSAIEVEERPLLKKQNTRTLLLSYLQETMAQRETFYRQAGIIFESRSIRFLPAQTIRNLLDLLDRYNRPA